MKKKAIEAIQFEQAPSDETHKFVASARVIELKGEENLLIDVFQGEKAAYRMAFTKKEWGMLEADTNLWSRCRTENMICGSIRYEKGETREDQIPYISAEGEDVIWNICEKWHKRAYLVRKYYSWHERLEKLIDDILLMQSNRRNTKRREKLQDRGDNTPDLPEDLGKWAKESLFPDQHFLYYKRHGRYADVACSACGKVKTVATKRKDTYEGMFESVIDMPKNNGAGRCPSCGVSGTWKSQGNAKGAYSQKRACFVGMPYKETGAVIRYVEIEKYFRMEEMEEGKELVMTGAGEHYAMQEIAREYFEPGKKRSQRDFHKYDGYTGKNFWDDCNLAGMTNIQINKGRVYPETWEMLKGTMLKHTGAQEYERAAGKINLLDYMQRYTQYKQIEFLSKMGLTKLVTEMVECRLGFISAACADSPERFLGIQKRRVKQLVAEQGEKDLLAAMQLEYKLEANWKDRELQFVRMIGYQRRGLYTALKYQTMQKLINKIAKWAGIKFTGDICSAQAGRLEAVSNTYFDYLQMREQREYDLTNTVFLWPHNLQEAHDLMVLEINAHKIELRNKEVEEKYPDIKKNYRKLREKYFYEDETYMIRPARSAKEIVSEGRFLHHCVGGDTYLSKHNTGISTILFLRFKETPEIPYITIEISGSKIIQWYGAYDKKPDRENIEKWLAKYADMVAEGIVRRTEASAMDFANMPIMAAAV